MSDAVQANRWDNLKDLGKIQHMLDLEARTCQQHDEDPSEQLEYGSLSRFLIIQEGDGTSGGTYLIQCTDVADLEQELASRLDEEYWSITEVWDLDTGLEVKFAVTVKVSL